MFRNNHQPFGYDSRGNIRSNFLDSLWKHNKFNALQENIKKFHKSRLTGTEVMYLSTEASILDTLMVTEKFNNVLVVSNHKDENIRFTNANYMPVKNYGHHLLPIIHKLNKSEYNLFVANESDNIFSKLYDVYDVNKVDIPDGYILDNTRVDIDTKQKFDAIILVNVQGMKKGKYQARNIKQVFSPYGTENFALIDLFVGDDRTLQPLPKIRGDIFNRIANMHRSDAEDYKDILNRVKESYKVY